jgi:hypothetical protein
MRVKRVHHHKALQYSRVDAQQTLFYSRPTRGQGALRYGEGDDIGLQLQINIKQYEPYDVTITLRLDANE